MVVLLTSKLRMHDVGVGVAGCVSRGADAFSLRTLNFKDLSNLHNSLDEHTTFDTVVPKLCCFIPDHDYCFLSLLFHLK